MRIRKLSQLLMIALTASVALVSPRAYAQDIDCKGAQGTQLGFTTMKVMGLDIPSWGTKSNQTSKVISEILV